jgi:hypothetical protein
MVISTQKLCVGVNLENVASVLVAPMWLCRNTCINAYEYTLPEITFTTTVTLIGEIRDTLMLNFAKSKSLISQNTNVDISACIHTITRKNYFRLIFFCYSVRIWPTVAVSQGPEYQPFGY